VAAVWAVAAHPRWVVPPWGVGFESVSVTPGSDEFAQPSRWQLILLAVVRPLVTVAIMLVIYYLLPVDRRLSTWTLVQLVLELALLVAVILWQVRRITRSPYPVIQGVQALAFVIPLFLVIFAYAYYILAHNLTNSFTTPLTRTDALYFVVTVFSTVGFGDITAATQIARILVTIQMVGDLLILGGVLRVIVTAVQRSRARPDRSRRGQRE
jgi:ion channel